MRKPILNLHSDKTHPPRCCDVIIDKTGVNLEMKLDKDKYEKIPWEDVVYQVEIAKKMAAVSE